MTLKRVAVIGTGTGIDPFRPNTADAQVNNILYTPDKTKCLYSTDALIVSNPDDLRVEKSGLTVKFVPDVVAAGGSLRGLLKGADPNESVRITLESGANATFSVDANGNAERAITIPGGTASGFYKITFLGLTSGKSCIAYLTVT